VTLPEQGKRQIHTEYVTRLRRAAGYDAGRRQAREVPADKMRRPKGAGAA